MKPEARRSPGVDPTQNTKLAVKMKSKLKFKSPEMLAKTTRKGTLVNQMTSTVNKKCYALSQTVVGDSNDLLSVSENDISGISPIKNSTSHECMDILTPKIVISCCSKPQKASRVSPKKVSRSKVRSPVNQKLKNVGGRAVKSSFKEVSRVQFQELEIQLRKKISECMSLTRKNNNLQKIVTEKDQIIRDLEIKFPKMLSELKKGMGQDNSKKKVNLELKETIKRNRQLSGAQKQTEDQLRIKEDKLKQALEARDVALDKLKIKEKESKEFLHRLSLLEKSVPELVLKLNEKESDLRRSVETVTNLEQRLKILTEDNSLKVKSIDQISNQLVDLNNIILEKEVEIVGLRQVVFELETNNKREAMKMKRLELEKTHLQKLIEQSNRPSDQRSFFNEGVNFDEATEDFLDKVSAVSKDQNVTVNLKLMVKKSRVSNVLENSTRISSPRNALETLTNEDKLVVNSRLEESIDEYPDEVFNNSIDFDEDMSVEDNEDPVDIIEDSNMSENAYDVSAGTMARAEELDSKVREMWTRLSCRDQTLDKVENDQCIKFTNSVSRLETDLNESILHHNRFMGQVCVAKKLFH